MVKRSHQGSDVCGHRMRNIRIRLLNLEFWVAVMLKRVSLQTTKKPSTVTKASSFDEIPLTDSREIDVNLKYHSLSKHSSIIRS